MTRRAECLSPRTAIVRTLLLAQLWMLLALGGADLLLAEEAQSEQKGLGNVLSYLAPKSATAAESAERTEPGILSKAVAVGWALPTTTSGGQCPLYRLPAGAVDEQLQTIRWNPMLGAKPASPAKRALPEGIQQAGFTAELPEPGAVELPPTESTAPILPSHTFNFWASDCIWVQFDGLLRGYYHNDQRIEWSGVEATFGAEGVLRPLIYVREDDWQISAEAEFFLNQPFGSSVFSNPLSEDFRNNFSVDTFQIFQLYVQARWQELYLRIGKSRTPFGRYYAPMFSNALLDAPFLRTEIIDWTETGIFLRYAPEMFCFDLALVNGEPNLDTNSSKAILTRLGINVLENFALGVSGKFQDGISSEEQKRYRSFYGLDFMYAWGRFILYGELLYDEHGFRRDFFALGGDPAFLGVRSLYGRDVYNGGEPATGYGYYVALGYRADLWLLDISYGDYFPDEVGDDAHDEPIHRLVAKSQYWITRNLQSFAVGIFENDRPFVAGLNRGVWAFLTGCQFTF